MNRILLCAALFIIAIPISASAQSVPCTVKYPAALDDLDSLCRAKDNPQGTLAFTINASVTTFQTTASVAAFPTTGLSLKIDNETILCTTRSGSTFSSCLRGQDGSTAMPHVAGSAVRMPILSLHHNTQNLSLVELEKKLGIGLSYAASAPTGTCPVKQSNGTTIWAACGGVSSFNGRSGVVVLASSDLNGLSGAGLTGIGTGTGGVINTGSTTIGADSDVNGVGVIDFQTRGVSRAQFNNVGSLVFPGTSALSLIQQITSTQPEYGNWNVHYKPFDINGETQQDHVVAFGWNVAGGGGPLVAGQGAFYEQFESHYRPGGVGDPRTWFEWHLNFWGYPGAVPSSSRPISIAADKVTGAVVVAIQGGFIAQSGSGTGNYIQGNETQLDFATDSFRVFNAAVTQDRLFLDSTMTLTVPAVLRSTLEVQGNFASRVLKFAHTPTAGEGVIYFGSDDTVNSVTIESGWAAPTHTTRTEGSLYLRRNSVPSAYVNVDGVVGWHDIPVTGFFGTHITLLDTSKQIRFANGWPPDVGMGRVAGPRMRITNADTGFGSLEVGTLYLNDGSVKQVTYGANDSGGSGFKLLRIPN